MRPGLFLSAVLFAVAAALPAAAMDAVEATAAPADGYARITLTWPENLAEAALEVDAEVTNQVLVARLSRAIDTDLAVIKEGLGGRAALARLDPDGMTLRVALVRPARVHVSRSMNVVAIDIVDPGRAADPPAVESALAARLEAAEIEARRRAAEAAARAKPVALPLVVRAAETEDYSRITFEWAEPVDHVLAPAPDGVEIRFAKDAVPDIALLRVDPPKGLVTAEADRSSGKLSVRLALDQGVETRSWVDGSNVIVDLIQPPPPVAEAIAAAEDAATEEAAEVAAVAPDPPEVKARANPVPEGGVVEAKVTPQGGDLHVAFDWAAPVGAAAFRRGDTLWIVFDAAADIDISELRAAAGERHIRDVGVVTGADFSAVRVTAAPATQIAAASAGARWTFFLGLAAPPPSEPIALSGQADGAGPPRLKAELHRPAGVRSVPDPAAGDALIVATAYGPPQGLPARRVFLEATALASAQGLALEAVADDLMARVTEDGVIVERPGGLALSTRRAAGPSAREIARLTATPGFIDFDAWSGPPEKFVETHDALMRRAAMSDAPIDDRVALARFLLGHELGSEALAILDIAIEEEPALLNDARIRALHGAANVLLARYEPAMHDFSAPPLARDSAAALWRGYLAAQSEDWREARRQFEEGGDALALFRSDWRGRFRAAYATAALALNDVGAAKRALEEALAEDLPHDVSLEVRLVEARYHDAIGEPDKALAILRELATSDFEPVETPALYEAARIEQRLGRLTPAEAVERLEELRLRWRGDATELEIARGLGQMYVASGDYRRGLTIMRAAALRFPEDPVARRIGRDMGEVFRRLYLEGEAERLDPVQALALWYEFNDLTPIGADGDRMIRRLADRLVEFDLLPQAAELLKHQVENRLRGVARAQVAAELAAIYLMDRRPEDALHIIQATRVTGLPGQSVAERRLLEARALAEVGRREHALELLATERAPAAERLKADIAWRMKDWTRAGRMLESSLGEAWKAPGPLSEDAERNVLRAAIAMNLAHDEEGLARLVDRYDAKMRAGAEGASWRIVAHDPDIDGVRLADMARRIAEVETLDAFIAGFRDRNAKVIDDAIDAEG